LSSPYNDSFYKNRHAQTLPMARIIVPLVREACGAINSVCDIGCGVGTFLSVFAEDGKTHVLGVEGAWLNKAYCVLPQANLVIADVSKPLLGLGRFDLVMSLEVAEHIDVEFADIFIANLMSLSDTVLFSAAVPGQGGVNHVNEQPHEYWINKFAIGGYDLRDCIRGRITNNESIFPWYRNNIMVFVKRLDSH
jgi:hypothetical protein